MTKKTLYLIPSTLGPNTETIAPYVREICYALDFFIVENLKSARRYLRSIGYKKNFDTEVTFFELNKHNKDELEPLFSFLNSTEQIGLLSEAGNPCIADPGASAVELCHEIGIKVKPLVGPSSILMALIASGFNGQNFSFHGYLPIETNERNRKIKSLENELRKTGYTQIFMETPYRNEKMIESLVKNCNPKIKLCVAADISLEAETIETRSIANWKNSRPNFHKKPAIFLLGN